MYCGNKCGSFLNYTTKFRKYQEYTEYTSEKSVYYAAKHKKEKPSKRMAFPVSADIGISAWRTGVRVLRPSDRTA